MAEPARPAEAAPGAVGRYLTFRMDRRLFALPAEEVAEVIRMPEVARIPQGPRSLLGVANLRGAVLPVASLRGLLGQAAATTSSAASRALVLDGVAPVVLAVDSIGSLVSVDLARIETDQIELAAEPGERLRGAFATGADPAEVARILDVKALLAEAFTPRTRTQRPDRTVAAGPGLGGPAPQARTGAGDARERLITFEVAGQEFALALTAVREVVAAPADLAAVPHAEALVLGVAAYREGLLPLLSLRGLLGFARLESPAEKVVVTRIGGVLVGLVVDRMRAVIAADPDLVEPVPAVLASRSAGETRISAIYRGEGGRRLISILAPEQLFREDVMERLRARRHGVAEATAATEAARSDDRRFLVFRLGEDEFGLPIEAVDEVAEAPRQVTRLPRTPDFLDGVVNRRGEVLPVVDQRRRFDMPALADGARRRMIVVRTERLRAGLLVDSVSEVLAAPASAIEPAPDLTGEAVRLVNGVLNLEQAGRLVLLLDPTELLSRAERGLLVAFQGEVETGEEADL